MTSPKRRLRVPEQKGTLAVGRLMLVAVTARRGQGVGRSGAPRQRPGTASREDAKAVVSIVRAAIQTRTVNQDEIR